MSAGSTRSYQTGTKESWRGFAWNRCAELAVHRGPVLYLAGPEDNDRIEAVKRGWPQNRIIAVDAEDGNVTRVKDRGGLAIGSRLCQVCRAWPETWPVSIVMADLCCGINRELIALLVALTRRPFHDAAICVNLLRGRDPLATELRPVVAAYLQMEIRGAEQMLDRLKRLPTNHLMRSDLEQKNRAIVIQLTEKLARGSFPRHDYMRAILGELGPSWHYATCEYRSGPQIFDSMIFRWGVPPKAIKVHRLIGSPLMPAPQMKEVTAFGNWTYTDDSYLVHEEGDAKPRVGDGAAQVAAMRRTIAAVKANSTRREGRLGRMVA